MRPQKGASNLISALREGGVRAECDKERDENRDPGESLTRAQNRSPPQNNLLGCAETCKFCFGKHLVNCQPEVTRIWDKAPGPKKGLSRDRREASVRRQPRTSRGKQVPHPSGG